MATANSQINEADLISFLDLHECIWINVFSYLNAFEQFYIVKTHSCFKPAIEYLQRRDLKRLYMNVTNFRSHNECAEFIEFVHPYVEYLKIDQMTVPLLNLISNLIFHNVRELDLVGSQDLLKLNVRQVMICGRYEQCIDAHIDMIAPMFPTLQKLTLRKCVIKGDFLGRFKLLQYLHLDYCDAYHEWSTGEIYRHTQLKYLDILDSKPDFGWLHVPLDTMVSLFTTLEHLKIKNSSIFGNSNLITCINRSNLRKLSIFGEPASVVLYIGTMITRNIIRLRLCGKSTHPGYMLKYICRIPDLEELVLQFDDSPSNDCILNEYLSYASTRLPKLRVVHVGRCLLENELGISEFIVNCPNLILLDVTYTNMSQNFVRNVISILASQRARTQPLELWIFGTGIIISELNKFPNLYSHNMLTINTTSCLKVYRSGVVKFTFGAL